MLQIDADIGFVSETWQQSDKNDVTATIKEKGFILRHVRRKNRDKEGGGGYHAKVYNQP